MSKKTVVIRVSEQARKRLKVRAAQKGLNLISYLEEVSLAKV